MCLRGAGGEDSPDSRALGKQRPATGRSAGGPGAARGWRLWRILFRTVNLEPTQTAYWKPEPEKDIKSPLIYCVCLYTESRQRVHLHFLMSRYKGTLRFALFLYRQPVVTVRRVENTVDFHHV